MKLYDYAASGNCYKVRLLLALLRREYERVAIDIFAGDTLTEEFGRLNPVRKTPVLELDDGRTIAQSNAILWYLAEGTEYLPASNVNRAVTLEWLFFEQERIMPGVRGTRFRRLTGRAAADPVADAARFASGVLALELLDGRLAGRASVAADHPTIADISLFAYTHVAAEAGFELDRYPEVSRWIEAIRELPGFVENLAPYPENARPGRARSIYDA